MIEFANLWAFVLLLLPLAVGLLLPAHKQSQDSLQVPYFDLLVKISGEKPASGATIMRRKRVQLVLLWLAWLCLVTAAAKPEWVGQPVQIDKSARDLMIAADLSGSMEVKDFTTSAGEKINRLDAVKRVLAEFAQRRAGDRLGLIVFGDAAYLQAPFTSDKETWLTLLSETEIAMAGPSTMMGDAIGLAISSFKGSDTKNKVLIVLTDGNDTGSRVPPVDAARVAKAHEVKIYTIAIGDPETVGEDAMDIDTLKEISNITGGAYFEALDRSALEDAYRQIEAMEPELYESLSFRPRQSIFHYPLAAIAILYAVSLPLMALSGSMQRRKVINV
ncbi:vWA domain-containing protein [Oceanicoccus sagamiensis]|uniref:Aerotolerance regulator BatA n=1 Tax=Oceanicoccus sagamiensis TaxID=716816 RepID=A0A1X9NF22_9GAMM|nr:VWA domain-containing protein [Oceanicoccus sagamiensis]ARN75761.1 aerotolerance regulator BatA [Oceanicoccus sagamiensis]